MLTLTTVKAGRKRKPDMANDVLASVGLNGKTHRLPSQISGGEKERVAIARAIVNAPPVFLAGEPKGNLDSKTTREVMELIQQPSLDGITVIIVTHSAEYAQKIFHLNNGRLIEP